MITHKGRARAICSPPPAAQSSVTPSRLCRPPAQRGLLGLLGRPRRAPPLGQLFRHGVLVKPPPRLWWEGKSVMGPPRRGSRPWRQRGHQDCMAAILDALLILAGQVGMIMADFVPISGYKRSKNRRDGRI